MDFDINNFMQEFASQLKDVYGSRLLFFGIQGSYARGEASEKSDIDLVVIIKDFSFQDLKNYKILTSGSQYHEKLCGFISGEEELYRWSKHDLFQLIFDTKAFYGDLFSIVKKPSEDDVRVFVKISSENLYHSTVHSYLYSQNRHGDLINLYKSVFYILQGIYYLKSGNFLRTKQILAEVIDEQDREIFEICLNRNNISGIDLIEIERLYSILISWSRDNIKIYT